MKKMHYGWVICITCTLLLFVTMGTVSNGFSVYLPYIMEEKGLTNAQTSWSASWCGKPFCPYWSSGFYYQKVSIRWAPPSPPAAGGWRVLSCCTAAEAYPCSASGAASQG